MQLTTTDLWGGAGARLLDLMGPACSMGASGLVKQGSELQVPTKVDYEVLHYPKTYRYDDYTS